MKPGNYHQTPFVLAALTLASLASPTARAATRYWDPNGGGSFGTINNTTVWVSPLNIVWTGSATGATSRLANYTTTLSDDCNWGGPVAALGGGTVPVGTVNAGTLNFNTISGTGTVTLSGGTITLKDASSVKVDHPTAPMTCTITSTLAGASTSLTKLGADTLVLSGSNIYTGSTIVSAGILSLDNPLALQNSPLDATNSVTGDAANGLSTTVTSLTFGGLSGTQDLASLFTTTSGGFDSLADLTLNPGDAVTNTYSGAIADGATGMTLTKDGLGTQVLAGANTFTGTTTVNAGTLTLDYSTQDNSKLSDTGALVLGSGTVELVGGTHTEVVGSATLTGNAKVTRTSGSAVLALGAITGTGSIDFSADNIATTTTPNNASGILEFATVGGSNLAANDGSGNIVAYTGYTDIDARGPSTVPDNANANVRILGDGTSGNIDLAAATTTINTLLQSNANFAATIDTAGKTLATTGIVVSAGGESLNLGVAAGDGTLQSPVAGGTLALTNSNAAKSLTINAAIADNTTPSGVGTAGAGTVVLAGANTYTGATVAGDGTLELSGSLAGSTVSVIGEGVLNQTSAGSISGAVTVTHDSSGTSTLAGSNSYSGATAVNAGILNIQNGAALGDTAAGTSVANGAVLQLQNDITVGAEALTLQGTGIAESGALNNVSGTNTYGGLVTLAGPTLITSDAGTLTLSDPGTITGDTFPLTVGGAGNTVINSIIGTTTGTLAKEGSGTLTITGANTYTGGVSVTAGSLNIQNDTALGTTAGGVVVANGAALQLEGGITVGAEALSMVGSGVSNTGALRNIGGDNTWGGAITLSVATRIQSDAGTLTLDVASGNAIAGTGPAAGGPANPPITFGGDGNITVADRIHSGNTRAGTITKQGGGTLTFQGDNTFTGKTVVSAGILSLENSLALQNSALDTAASVTGDGTNGLRTTVTALTMGGLTGDKNLADVFTTASGGFDSVTALTFNTPSGATHSYSGGIANGAAGMTLTKNNSGTQVLSGPNSYTGTTTINAGTLALGASDVLPDASNVTLGGGTLDAATFTDTAGTLDVSGTAAINLGSGATLAFANSNGTWAGTLNITGTFVPGSSLRFGSDGNGLSASQLAAISATSFGALALDSSGYLIEAPGYASWQSTNGTAQAIDLDHDNDGVQNGVEYFLGGPTGNTTGFTALPGATDTGGILSVTWTKGPGYQGVYGPDFVVQTSTTLASGSWTDVAEGTGANTVEITGNDVKYTFAAGTMLFARLKVTGP